MAGIDYYRMDLKIVELSVPGLEFCPKLRLGWSCDKFTTYTHWRNVVDGKVSWNTPLSQHSDSPIKDSVLILYQKLNTAERAVGLQKVPNGLMTAIVGNLDQKVTWKCQLEEMKKFRCEVNSWIRCTKINRNPELSAISSHEHSRSYRAGDMEFSVNTISTSVTAADSVDLSLDLTGDLPKVFFPIVTLEEVYFNLLNDNFIMSPRKEKFIDLVKIISCIPADVNQFELSQEDIDQVPHIVRMFIFMEMQRQMDHPVGSNTQRWNIAQCDIVGLQAAVYRFLQGMED